MMLDPGAHLIPLPYHEGGDVPKGTGYSPCICRYHHVDAGKGYEVVVVSPDGRYDGAHQQRSGQVVRKGRYAERQAPCEVRVLDSCCGAVSLLLWGSCGDESFQSSCVSMPLSTKWKV